MEKNLTAKVQSEAASVTSHEIMTLEEAADFLRVSRSTLYQRGDIPRHRMPRSREFRYLRTELLAWLKGEALGQQEAQAAGNSDKPLLTLATAPKAVYHRSARYR